MVFIRAQSTIRADGTPSAQCRACCGGIIPAGAVARLRAPTIFLARIKDIRPKNTVLVKGKDGIGVLYEIADCARMVYIRVQSAIRADGTPSAQNPPGKDPEFF